MNVDLSERSEQARMNIIAMMLDIGSMRAVNGYMSRWSASLEASESEQRRKAFAELRKRVVEARQIEEVSGNGSLLDLDHPSVVGIVKRYLKTGEEPELGRELAAAILYRRDNSMADGNCAADK